MTPYIVLLLATSLLVNVGLLALVRYLSIAPSFRIAVPAIGWLRLWVTFGPRIWVMGDIDGLGLTNDAFTTSEQGGWERWDEIMAWVCHSIRADDQALVFGGDEFRWGLRLNDTRYGRQGIKPEYWQDGARRFGERVQALLREAPYRDEEREALRRVFGHPYVTITLAGAYSPGWRHHRKAIRAAMTRVANAKPKKGTGQRGQILEAVTL